MRRIVNLSSLLLASFLSLSTVACFGDNSDEGEEEEPQKDTPVIVDITALDEIDTDAKAPITVKVKGKADQQLSVAVDTALGSFTPQNATIITDGNGDGTFTTLYSSGAVGGSSTFTVNVSTLAELRTSKSRNVTIHGVERLGNVIAITHSEAEQADYLIAYPFELTTARTLTKIAIVAPASATALVGLYASTVGTPTTAKPTAALVRMTATLVAGANEISIDPLPLAEGRYWMAVSYMGVPLVNKNIDVGASVSGWRINGHLFSSGLPERLDAALATNLAIRNFYLVLRK